MIQESTKRHAMGAVALGLAKKFHPTMVSSTLAGL